MYGESQCANLVKRVNPLALAEFREVLSPQVLPGQAVRGLRRGARNGGGAQNQPAVAVLSPLGGGERAGVPVHRAGGSKPPAPAHLRQSDCRLDAHGIKDAELELREKIVEIYGHVARKKQTGREC
ncbi:hypothetical protein HDU88_001016 [Geranomyces variabilis]|nr:hypothetical protein HDU88_001016 [Geranomyces variabilis]